MGRYTGPKTKVSRRYGVPLFGPAKALERKNYPPGMHGPKGSRRKQSDYAIALGEKQKLRYQYGLLEKQFRRIFQTALRKRGVTGETLLQLLETRLDNVVFRLGLANTRSAARQLVSHGHVQVNGRNVNIASYNVKAGDEVTVKDKPKSRQLALRNLELTQIAPVPESRCAQRQSLAHSHTRRDAADGQRAVDRRVVFALAASSQDHRRSPRPASLCCQQIERFVVTAALKKMPQLRIDRWWQALLDLFDPFRNLPEPLHVLNRIAPAFFVGNDREALSQGRSELGQRFFHRKSLKRSALSRKRPFMGSGAAKKILIVDDDVGLMGVMREALISFVRCEVDTSPNPEYGFELALKKTYDLLIFDFSMPMIDGAMLFLLIGKAYNHAQPPRIVPPLLLVTGRGDESRAQELLKEAGVRGLVAKPFVINRLLEKVKECLPGIESTGVV